MFCIIILGKMPTLQKDLNPVLNMTHDCVSCLPGLILDRPVSHYYLFI